MFIRIVADDYENVLCSTHLGQYVCLKDAISFSRKLRKEADDIGPAAELDHWKQRMAKFNR